MPLGTSLASIMFSTRTLAALAVAFSPLALAATLISDDTMINYLNAGGLDLAYANSPFVTPPYRLDWPPHRTNQLMMRAVLQSVVFWSSYESASLVYSTLLHDSLFPTDFPFII